MKPTDVLCSGWVIAVLAGCATGGVEKRLDDKIAQEPVESRAQLTAQAVRTLDTAPNLSASQREALSTLRRNVSGRTARLGEESLKLRAILMRDLVASPYDGDEVELIQSRLRDLEQERVTAVLEGVKEANRILGREATANRRLLDDMWDTGGVNR